MEAIVTVIENHKPSRAEVNAGKDENLCLTGGKVARTGSDLAVQPFRQRTQPRPQTHPPQQGDQLCIAPAPVEEGEIVTHGRTEELDVLRNQANGGAPTLWVDPLEWGSGEQDLPRLGAVEVEEEPG